MSKRTAVLSAAVLVALAACVTACTDTTEAPKQPHAKVTASQPSGDGAAQEDESTLTVALDHTVKWRNGVTAQLSNFTRGVSSENAYPGGTADLGFTVSVKNGTKAPLGLSGWSLSCPDGADEVFDSENGLNGTPDIHVLPGQRASWKAACTFKQTQTQAQIELTPSDVSGGWYRTAIFTGDVK